MLSRKGVSKFVDTDVDKWSILFIAGEREKQSWWIGENNVFSWNISLKRNYYVMCIYRTFNIYKRCYVRRVKLFMTDILTDLDIGKNREK